MERISGCKVFMYSFSERYLLSRCFSDRNFFILDTLFHILPHFIILFYIFSSKHAIFRLTGNYLALILLGDLFNDFAFILL
jgi:hypothetical protein